MDLRSRNSSSQIASLLAISRTTVENSCRVIRMTREYLDIPGFPHARSDYSDLERFQDDETVRALEPRNAAPELDTARLAPEVSGWP